MNQLKAILITLDKHRKPLVQEVMYADTDVDEIAALLKCAVFTGAGRFDNTDYVLVDDEGLFKTTKNTQVTLMKHYPQPLFGNILITGVTPTGESQDALSTVEDVEAMIKWSMTVEEGLSTGLIKPPRAPYP